MTPLAMTAVKPVRRSSFASDMVGSATFEAESCRGECSSFLPVDMARRQLTRPCSESHPAWWQSEHRGAANVDDLAVSGVADGRKHDKKSVPLKEGTVSKRSLAPLRDKL